MAYSRFDDLLDGHPKRRKVGWEAFGLWCGAIIHCSKYLTNGHVDSEWLEEAVPQRPRRDKLVSKLVEYRMFEPNGSGFRVHDYLDYNPSKAEVEERRRKAAKKKADQRKSQGDTHGDS